MFSSQVKWHLLLFTILILQGVQILNYYKRINYSYINAIESIESIIPEDESLVIAGDIAMQAVMMMKKPALALDVTYKQELLSQKFREWKPQYLLLEETQLFNSIQSHLRMRRLVFNF